MNCILFSLNTRPNCIYNNNNSKIVSNVVLNYSKVLRDLRGVKMSTKTQCIQEIWLYMARKNSIGHSRCKRPGKPTQYPSQSQNYTIVAEPIAML